MKRRALLSTTSLAAAGLVLAACGVTQPSQAGTVPAQILTDTNGALVQLDAILPALSATTPPIIPAALEKSLLQDVNYAFQSLQTVSSSTPAQTGATVLARVEGYGGAVLTALLAVPLPPPYNLAVIAANVVWASLEVYVNSLLPPVSAGGTTPPPAPQASFRATGRTMSIEEARAILKIPAPAN